MKIQKLKLQNFRSFTDVEIRFPDSGAILIRGDSGAGKSSIFLAISYLLDILPTGFSGSKLKNWSASEAMQVSADFLIDGVMVELAKGKDTYIKTPSETISGAKAYAEALPRVLKISPDILSSMVYRPQRKPGMLVSMTATEKAEFLTAVLGLQKIEEEIENSKHKQSKLQAKIDKNTTAIKYLSSVSLAPCPPKILNEEMLRDELSEAKERHQCALTALSDAQNTYDSESLSQKEKNKAERIELAEQADKATKFLSSMKSKLYEIQSEKYRISEEIKKETKEAAQLSAFKKEQDSLEQQLRQLGQNICAMCGQSWNNSEDAQNKIVGKIHQLLAKQILCQEAEQKAVQLRSQLLKVESQIAELSQKIATAESKTKSLFARVSSLEDFEVSAEIKNCLILCKKQESEAKEKMHQADKALQYAILDNKNNIQRFEDEQKRVIELKKQFDKENQELAVNIEQINLEKDFCKTVGKDGFLSMFFADVLKDISDRANVMLRELPNVAGVSVSIAPESNKTGSKRLINLEVTVDGKEVDISSGLSGGQQAVVEQVVDLSLAQVLQDRTGRTPGFMMLDETLYGFGNSTKEAILEVLSHFAKDKLVLVIDHSSEIKEMFSSTIDIVKQNGVSTLYEPKLIVFRA